MLVRNIMLAVLSAGLLAAADTNVLTPDLAQLPPEDFNKLLMQSLAQGQKPLTLEQMALLEAPRTKAARCAIRLREYRVHDLDAAASLPIPPGAANSDKIGVPPPVPACP